MVDILHRVGIEASPARVYEAIATPAGVAAWWSTETVGDSNSLTVRFGAAAGFDIAVTGLEPGRRVEWSVVGGPDEWVDTRIRFDLEAEGEWTIVRFIHSGWRQPTDYMHECSTQWAVFLLSLKALLETGKGQPYPHGIDIHGIR